MQVPPPPIERPMDLFKAIFETGGDEESDEESDEGEPPIGPSPPPALEAAEKLLLGHGNASAVGECTVTP